MWQSITIEEKVAIKVGQGITSEDRRQMDGGDVRIVSDPIAETKGTPSKAVDP